MTPHGGLRRAISNVMALDYLGELVASLMFPFVLLPVLSLALLQAAMPGCTADAPA